MTYLGTRLDGLVRRDRSLGLPAPSSDIGMPATWGDPSRPDAHVADGGSPALDVYLDAARAGVDGGEGGRTTCVHWQQPRGKRAKTAAYVTLENVRTFGQRDLDRVVHDAAHELVHAAQCAIRNGSGTVDGTALGLGLVEGSAEAFAVASSGKLDETMLQRAIVHPGVVLSPTATPHVDPYSQFPFWYRLFGAPSARRYVAFLRTAVAAARSQHARGDIDLVYRSFGEAAVQRALTASASFAVLGGEIGGAVHDPAASGLYVAENTLGQLAPALNGSAAAHIRLAAGAYGYIVVAWPTGASRMTVSATGVPAARAAESIAPGTRTGGVVAPAGGTWHLSRSCDADGRCNEGEAYITVADGRRTPFSATITVAASP